MQSNRGNPSTTPQASRPTYPPTIPHPTFAPSSGHPRASPAQERDLFASSQVGVFSVRDTSNRLPDTALVELVEVRCWRPKPPGTSLTSRFRSLHRLKDFVSSPRLSTRRGTARQHHTHPPIPSPACLDPLFANGEDRDEREDVGNPLWIRSTSRDMYRLHRSVSCVPAHAVLNDRLSVPVTGANEWEDRLTDSFELLHRFLHIPLPISHLMHRSRDPLEGDMYFPP